MTQGYLFSHDPERTEVAEYIGLYPFLEELLREVREQLGIHFGDSEVYLEVSADPEGTDRSLVATVLTTADADEAHRRLAAFDEWWIPNVHRAQNKLLVTVGFI